MATLARRQRDTTVSGRLKIFDQGGVFLANSSMIGWLETGDELTGAVAKTLVVVVAITSSASIFPVKSNDLSVIPFKVLTRTRAIPGNPVQTLGLEPIVALSIEPFAVVLSYMPK